jgi:hypothetical protein
MKSFDYDAVVCDGEVYCSGCEPEDADQEEMHPVFADSEWDYYPTCSHCGYRHEYVSLTSEGERYEREQAGPQEEDITVSDCGPLGSLYAVAVVGGKFIGEYRTWEETVKAIKDHMEEDQFFPTVWRISDHGNAHILTEY